MSSLLSDESDRGGPRAGCAAQLRMGENERELAYAVGCERARVEVLHDEDAVPDVQRLRHVERPRRILGGYRAVAPRVAAGQRDTAGGQPLGELEPGARLAGEIGVGVVPAGAPPRVEEDGVARLWIELADVVEGDHVARSETVARDVDEVAARDDLRHRLDSERRYACGRGEVRDPMAVVGTVCDLQMAERVEVR